MIASEDVFFSETGTMLNFDLTIDFPEGSQSYYYGDNIHFEPVLNVLVVGEDVYQTSGVTEYRKDETVVIRGKMKQ